MTRQWHANHLVLVRDGVEVERLGSIVAEPVDPPMAWWAAGACHRMAVLNLFIEARQYLDGPGNRSPVEPETWNRELNQ